MNSSVLSEGELFFFHLTECQSLFASYFMEDSLSSAFRIYDIFQTATLFFFFYMTDSYSKKQKGNFSSSIISSISSCIVLGVSAWIFYKFACLPVTVILAY